MAVAQSNNLLMSQPQTATASTGDERTPRQGWDGNGAGSTQPAAPSPAPLPPKIFCANHSTMVSRAAEPGSLVTLCPPLLSQHPTGTLSRLALAPAQACEVPILHTLHLLGSNTQERKQSRCWAGEARAAARAGMLLPQGPPKSKGWSRSSRYETSGRHLKPMQIGKRALLSSAGPPFYLEISSAS